MYKRPKRISGESLNIDNYINGADVFDSYVIKQLTDPTLDRRRYTITKYEFRPDLIAADIYGSAEYQGVLMIQCGFKLEDYYVGNSIDILPKSTIDGIISFL